MNSELGQCQDTKKGWARGLGVNSCRGKKTRNIQNLNKILCQRNNWRKKQSKITISDLVGLCAWSSMAKVRGQNSNMNTVKQTAKNGQKNLGWRRRGRYYVTGARRQEFEAVELSWVRPGVIGLLRQVAYELISANHEHFESFEWPCMIAGWHHWHHKRLHVPFFRRLFDCVPVQISTLDLHHWILRKKNLSDQSLWFWSAVFHEGSSWQNRLRIPHYFPSYELKLSQMGNGTKNQLRKCIYPHKHYKSSVFDYVVVFFCGFSSIWSGENVQRSGNIFYHWREPLMKTAQDIFWLFLIYRYQRKSYTIIRP